MSDHIGRDIRQYYETVIIRVDPYAVHSTEPVPRRGIRRGVAIAVAAAVLVGLALGVIPFLLRSNPPVVDEPTTTSSIPTSTTIPEAIPPTSIPEAIPVVPTPVNPLLAPFYTLGPCGQTDQLAVWMSDTVPEAIPAVEGLTAVGLEEAMSITPFFRSEQAACVDSLAFLSGGSIEVAGWQLLDQTGEMIGRAVAQRHDDDLTPLIDDPELRSAGGEYHQDWVGSGQSLTGWVLDGMVAADTNLAVDGRDFVRFIIEIPGYELPTEGRAEGNAGADLIGRLSLADLAPLTMPAPALTPTSLPEGFFRCWGPYWRGRIPPIPEYGEVTAYCNTEGETIHIGIYPFGLSGLPQNPTRIQVSETDFAAYQTDEGSRLISGRISEYGDIVVQAPPTVTLDDVVAMLESIPALDPRQLNPSDGSNDLRPLFSEEWVLQILTEAGASDIEFESRLGPPLLEVTYQPIEGSPAVVHGIFNTYEVDSLRQGSPDATQIRTHNNVDIFITRIGNGPAGQAIAYCGGIVINIILEQTGGSDPVIDAIESILEHAGC